MKLLPMVLPGAFVVEIEPIVDERGFFARTFCRNEFAEHRLNPDLVQCSVSYNLHKGTLRGMHYQKAPHAETKLVRCTMGTIYDVIVDLRSESPTFKRWAGVELSAENHKALYIPEGFAHGFLTLADRCEVFYQMSSIFHSASAAGVRWDDAAFAIDWPGEVRVMSERDRNYQDYPS